MIGNETEMSLYGRRKAPPNKTLHLTGATILVLRDTRLLQRPRQVGSAFGLEVVDVGERKITRRKALLAGGAVVLGTAGVAGYLARSPRRESLSDPGDVPMADIPEKLRARVVSWDIGFKPPSEKEWIACVSKEVGAAAAAEIDVLVFPELFAAGLGPYAPKGKDEAEFVTRRMNDAVLPAVKEAAKRSMLVALGTYWYQESGWKYAFNRAPVLIDGSWFFADKLHPTPGELIGNPPPVIKPGNVLPLFRFRGGTASVVICFSLEMPEVSAALKKEGVQLVLGPSATEDEDGVARVLRASSARAVELGAAVLVAPLVGAQGEWKNSGSAALYLPAQKGIDHRPQENVRRKDGIAHDDLVIPWKALIDLRQQADPKPETRPFLTPAAPFHAERKG
jgi:predicted amidohydrolase